jgi:hypothetical protein
VSWEAREKGTTEGHRREEKEGSRHNCPAGGGGCWAAEVAYVGNSARVAGDVAVKLPHVAQDVVQKLVGTRGHTVEGIVGTHDT